jgi:hypothetical protein
MWFLYVTYVLLINIFVGILNIKCFDQDHPWRYARPRRSEDPPIFYTSRLISFISYLFIFLRNSVVVRDWKVTVVVKKSSVESPLEESVQFATSKSMCTYQISFLIHLDFSSNFSPKGFPSQINVWVYLK